MSFEEQAREYVNALDYMTSGEAQLCHDLYADAVRADANLERFGKDMEHAHAIRQHNLYREAHDLKRESFEDGRDAVSRIRSLIRNANTRAAHK